MSINNNSFSTATNITFGSNVLDGIWLNAQSCIIPSLSLSPPKIGGRRGAQINLAGDTVTYTDLTIDVILDKEWEVYDNIYKYFLDGLNVEKGTFSSQAFDLWLEIRDGSGKPRKKFWFYNCRLNDLGEVPVSNIDAGDELNVFTLAFTFDYMEYDNSFFTASLG